MRLLRHQDNLRTLWRRGITDVEVLRSEFDAHGYDLVMGRGAVLPRCNTEGMTLHLAGIAATVAPGAHAVLLVDQAGWHGSDALIVPPNITLMPLPSKCPELNPVESIWQFMRDNWLSNRIFRSYEDILDHCCLAWNRLVDQPWRIMAIGHANGPMRHDQRDLV